VKVALCVVLANIATLCSHADIVQVVFSSSSIVAIELRLVWTWNAVCGRLCNKSTGSVTVTCHAEGGALYFIPSVPTVLIQGPIFVLMYF
jgi:hypothetical protein